MSMRKAVFFDIDGTIWDRNNYIPESTIKAVRTLQKNGHLAFLCTGRTKGFIREPALLSIGFDGIVSGCGTMIEYKDETIFYRQIEKAFLEETLLTLRKYRFRPILEGREYLYLEMEDFAGDSYARKLIDEMGPFLHSISEDWGKWEVQKFSCATEDADREACFAALEDHYDFMIHNEAVAEFVPKGFDKGFGLRKTCELLGVDISDTFSFGDSVNDIGMLKAAGTGIAMGNGSPLAMEAADYVTRSLLEDGIYHACRHFSLI